MIGPVFVQGTPVPQGSVSPMPYMKKGGKGMGVAVFQKPKLVEWRNKVADTVRPTVTEIYAKGTPLHVVLHFRLLRPKSSKLEYPCNKKIDLDKAIRAVGDALTGIAYDDDCQLVSIFSTKSYVKEESEEGVYIIVAGVDEEIPVTSLL